MNFLFLTFSTLLMSLTWSYSGSKVTFQRSPDPFTFNASTSNVSLPHLTATTLSITPIYKKQLLLANQNYTTVRGTRISLIKPEGFTEAKNFPGFQQTDTGASIVVTEMPASYSQIASTFNTKNLKNRGMTLLRKQNFTIDGYKGQFFIVGPAFSKIEVTGQTYYIMQGIVGSGLKTEYLDDFQKMARSFRLK